MARCCCCCYFFFFFSSFSYVVALFSFAVASKVSYCNGIYSCAADWRCETCWKIIWCSLYSFTLVSLFVCCRQNRRAKNIFNVRFFPRINVLCTLICVCMFFFFRHSRKIVLPLIDHCENTIGKNCLFMAKSSTNFLLICDIHFTTIQNRNLICFKNDRISKRFDVSMEKVNLFRAFRSERVNCIHTQTHTNTFQSNVYNLVSSPSLRFS